MKTQRKWKKALLPALIVAVMVLLFVPLLVMPAAAENSACSGEHIWDDGVVIIEPTTTATGLKSYTCTACGTTKTEELPVIVTVVTGTCGDNATWSLDLVSWTLTISGTGKITGSWEDYKSSIKTVLVEDGIEDISAYTFQYCTSLTTVTIPSSVKNIGSCAFRYCSSLESIEIPSAVPSIGWATFYYCHSLASIVFEDGSQVTSIGTSAFENCYKLESITIPSGVTSIGKRAFAGCSALANATIPSAVESINEEAFAGCSSLTSIVIPDSVISIGNRTFSSCTKVRSITFGEKSQLVSIGDSAFYGCGGIQSENGVSYVGKWVIGCDSSASSASLRSDTVGIGHSAFASCKSITSIIIPASVKYINTYAYSKCASLSVIHYEGTQAQWNKINNANEPTQDVTIICYGISPITVNVLLGDKFSANAKIIIPDNVTTTEAGLYVDGVKMTGVQTDGYYLVEGFLKTAAKETGKTVVVQAYYVTGGVEVKGNVITTSIASLLRAYLASTDVEIVALATATLNYAAAAQVYFGYDVENLVNEGLAATLPRGEYTDNFAVIEANPDAILAPREIALLLNDTVDLHVRAGKLISPAVNYAEYYLAVSENADMSGATTVAFDEKGIAVVKAISPTKWNDTYYFCIVDGEGNAVSATFSYGVSTYYARMAADDDANLTALVDAMMALYEANEAYLAEPYVPEGNQTEPDDISGIF